MTDEEKLERKRELRRARQARMAQRMKEQGFHRMKIWLTDEELEKVKERLELIRAGGDYVN